MGTITINSTDRVFATLSRFGSIIYNVELSGVTSMSDVVRRIRGEVKSGSGILSLTLRNSSQGWSRSASIML